MLRPVISIIIPASNEEAWIADCLAAVFASDPLPDAEGEGAIGPGGGEVIVVANGCSDRTAAMARDVGVPSGWQCQVIEREDGSKPVALSAGDAVAQAPLRAYLDADCRVTPALFAQICGALGGEAARYAAATPVIPRPRSRLSRAYARFWSKLPFARSEAAGYGLYAVNAAGRARWGAFPHIISDDTFVRLQFTPEERVQVAARYDWPMIEGFRALVRVRRRQNAGVAELEALSPGIFAREGKARLGGTALLSLLLRDPTGFAAYAAVALAVRLKRGSDGFTRGR